MPLDLLGSDYSFLVGSLLVSRLCYEDISWNTPNLDELKSITKLYPHVLREISYCIESLEFVDINYDNTNDFVLRMILAKMEIEGTKVLFVGFRGTRVEYLRDWLSSANILADYSNKFVKGQRHKGYSQLGDLVTARYFLDLLEGHDIQQLVFCGHSLGGAIAKVVAVNFLLLAGSERRHSSIVKCITLSDPMSFGIDFVTNLVYYCPNFQDIFHTFAVAGDIIPIILGKKLVSESLVNVIIYILKIYDNSGKSDSKGLEGIAIDAGMRLFLPDLCHIGTMHVFQNREHKVFSNDQEYKDFMTSALSTEPTYMSVLQSHNIDTLVMQSESVINLPANGHKKKEYKVSISFDYRINNLPFIQSAEILRYKESENNNTITNEKLRIVLNGSNFEKFRIPVNTPVIFHYNGITRNDLFNNVKIIYVGEIMLVEMDVCEVALRGEINWDLLYCVISPQLLPPISMSEGITLQGSNKWSNASPIEIIQSAFIMSLLNGILDPDLIQTFRSYLDLIDSHLQELNDDITNENRQRAIEMFRDKSDVVMKQKNLDTYADIKETFPTMATPLLGNQKNSPVTKLKEDFNEKAEGNAKINYKSELSSFKFIFDCADKDSAANGFSKIPILETYLKKSLPLSLFIAFELSRQGHVLTKTRTKFLTKVNYALVGLGIGIFVAGVTIATGGIAAAAGAFGALSYVGATGVGAAFATAGTAGFLGIYAVKNNLPSKVLQACLIRIAGDYKIRIIEFLEDFGIEKKETNGKILEELEDQLNESCNNSTSMDKLKTQYDKKDHNYLEKFLASVQLLTKIRKTLKELRIVGILGNHTAGKSTFLHEAYGFGEETNAPIRTEIIVPRVHLSLPNVIFLDFPGANEAGVGSGTLKVMSSIVLTAVVIFTTLENEITSYIKDSVIVPLVSSNAPMLLCSNKVDLYHESACKGKGTKRKPQFSNEMGLIFVIQRFFSILSKTESFKNSNKNFEVWMTKLNGEDIDEELSEGLESLRNRTDEKLLEIIRESGIGRLNEIEIFNHFHEIKNFISNEKIFYTINDVKSFIAEACFKESINSKIQLLQLKSNVTKLSEDSSV